MTSWKLGMGVVTVVPVTGSLWALVLPDEICSAPWAP